jgi:hypothetical protein
MVEITYNLGTVEDYDMSIVYNSSNASSETESSQILNSLKLESRMWRYKDKTYQIIRYDKNFLACDRISTSGLFRSVIFRKGKIIVFSPPKSEYPNEFETQFNAEDCIAQEYMEGTMINLFYDEENCEWEIATRSSIGGKMTFYTAGKVENSNIFRNMFLEASSNASLEFDDLSKDYCYSFVLQHPNNRIVTPFNEIKLYLVSVFKIDNFLIKSIDLENIKPMFNKTSIYFPENFSFSTFSELKDKYASGNTDYKYVGVMVYHKSGARTKFRNPNYELVRQLRGNEPKKQYRYLVLRQQDKVMEYLKYYNEDSKDFYAYKEQVHSFTRQLHQNYIQCFVKKQKPLSQYPFQYKSHMFELHSNFISRLRAKKQFISKKYVIDYVNSLHPAKLMFSLNYQLRQLNNDEQQKSSES